MTAPWSCRTHCATMTRDPGNMARRAEGLRYGAATIDARPDPGAFADGSQRSGVASAPLRPRRPLATPFKDISGRSLIRTR